MSEADAAVRILLVQPNEVDLHGVGNALASLGASVQVDMAPDLRRALSRIADSSPELVVAHAEGNGETSALLEALRATGPPVVVITADADSTEVALDLFQRGAAECVAEGPAFADLLRQTVLEQIQKWREVTERRDARRRVDDLRRYTADVVQTMNGGLVVLDPSGCIRFANGEAERLLGAKFVRLQGRPLSNSFSNAGEGAAILERALRGGERVRSAESLLRQPEGATVPVAISCAPLRESSGARSGAVAVFQDLSEIKQLQRQMTQTEKMASIGQLAAGVAHEINNPAGFVDANLRQMSEYAADLQQLWEHVTGLRRAAESGSMEKIRSAAGVLDASIEKLDADFLLRDLATAIRESQEGSERIRHIVQDLRDFARPDPDEPERADLIHCVDSTANIVWSMMKHSVILQKDYQPLPPIECFPMQLKQVFMNLLMNAYQAILARGAEPGTVRIRSSDRGEHVCVEVIDDGVGIPAENLDRICDPFFTTKDVGVGMGLGLSTAFSIVRRHGGELEIHSEKGHGTRVEVVLPIKRPGSLPKPRAIPRAS